MRNKDADVILFIDVLLDEDGNRVFSDDDSQIVREIYGPVHKRLLSAALALGVDQDQAEKSKRTADVLSCLWRSGWGAPPRTPQHDDGQ
jgi:hypothetical protein